MWLTTDYHGHVDPSTLTMRVERTMAAIKHWRKKQNLRRDSLTLVELAMQIVNGKVNLVLDHELDPKWESIFFDYGYKVIRT